MYKRKMITARPKQLVFDSSWMFHSIMALLKGAVLVLAIAHAVFGGVLHQPSHEVDVPPVEAEARSSNAYLPPDPEPPGYEYPVPEKPFEIPESTPLQIIVTDAPTTPVPDVPTPVKVMTPQHHHTIPPTAPTAPPVVQVPEGTHEHHEHHHEHMPYEFRYVVLDENEGTDFSETAVADENGVIRGEYRVLLPDGRRQIVTYVADWREGYNADVQYEGTAVYPPAGSTNRKQRSNKAKRQSLNQRYFGG